MPLIPNSHFCRYGHGDNVPVPPLSLWHSYTRAGTLLRYEDILHQNLSSSFPVAVSTPQTLPSVILLVWSNRWWSFWWWWWWARWRSTWSYTGSCWAATTLSTFQCDPARRHWREWEVTISTFDQWSQFWHNQQSRQIPGTVQEFLQRENLTSLAHLLQLYTFLNGFDQWCFCSNVTMCNAHYALSNYRSWPLLLIHKIYNYSITATKRNSLGT